MLLQPLVENAIKYAVAKQVAGGLLRIEAERDGDLARIQRLKGEMAVLTGQPRSATVVALQPTTCATLGQTALQTLLTHRPRIALALTATLAAMVPDQPFVPFAAAVLGLSVVTSSARGEAGDWFAATWELAKQILPLLFLGVLVAGALLGRPGHEGLIPSAWVAWAVGGNSLGANLFASIIGAFMYFATLTEIPILQGLIGSDMGKGPALALLLAGPALSLPSMLVLRGVMGTKKTAVYVGLVVVMATASGAIYGAWF